MRIAYVASPPLFSKGASGIHVMKMCQAMAKLGHSVELILPSYNNKIDIYEYYAVEPIFKLTPLPSLDGLSIRPTVHGFLSSIYTKLKRSNFDLVVTRNIFYTFISTKLFRIPTIYDAHHPLVNKAAHSLFKSFKESNYLLRFSTNSHGLANIYSRLGLPEDKLVVAHNGVDLERFEAAVTKEEARRKLGLPHEKEIVCYSGNFYPGRGLDLLIDVAEELRHVLFIIVGGTGDDIENYRRRLREREIENFLLIGFVPHRAVPHYLFASDVLIMPYTSRMTIRDGSVAAEFTSPIKLFEYMASGRPIVATALPSIKEVLEDNRNAILVEPDSAHSVLDGIKKALSDQVLTQRIVARAASDIRRYTWEERVKRILDGLD